MSRFQASQNLTAQIFWARSAFKGSSSGRNQLTRVERAFHNCRRGKTGNGCGVVQINCRSGSEMHRIAIQVTRCFDYRFNLAHTIADQSRTQISHERSACNAQHRVVARIIKPRIFKLTRQEVRCNVAQFEVHHHFDNIRRRHTQLLGRIVRIAACALAGKSPHRWAAFATVRNQKRFHFVLFRVFAGRALFSCAAARSKLSLSKRERISSSGRSGA